MKIDCAKLYTRCVTITILGFGGTHTFRDWGSRPHSAQTFIFNFRKLHKEDNA